MDKAKLIAAIAATQDNNALAKMFNGDCFLRDETQAYEDPLSFQIARRLEDAWTTNAYDAAAIKSQLKRDLEYSIRQLNRALRAVVAFPLDEDKQG